MTIRSEPRIDDPLVAPRRRRTENTTQTHSTVTRNPMISLNFFLSLAAISALIVGIYIQVAKNLSEKLNQSENIHSSENALVLANNLEAGYLDHVIDSLLRHGYNIKFANPNSSHRFENTKIYNLVWSHEYPFQAIKNLMPNQRINHFPGIGFITSKATLSTTPQVPNLLKAFKLPIEKDRFLEYSSANPDKQWIQKSSSHRGITIETSQSVNLELNDTLVQEFMSNPLLIDGKKFDIGIYAVLTSVEPLRVYIYDSESLIRFCAKPYFDLRTNLFNASDIDSYVVGDDYTPIWLMPALIKYYIGTNLSMKETINSYLKRFDKDASIIWEQIEETIKNVFKVKEDHIAKLAKLYQASNNYNATSVEGSLNQFFEMVRFDFIIDQNLKVYLMEANMSPNLSSRHFPPNRLLYEQVLDSYFSLVGLTEFSIRHLSELPVNHLDGKLTLPKNSIKVNDYGLDGIIGEKELSVYEELCSSDECHMNCFKTDCQVCYFCLDYSDKLHLRRAIFEHLSKWNFKRLLPSTKDDDIALQLKKETLDGQNVDANFLHVQWFRGKCYKNPSFCSY